MKFHQAVLSFVFVSGFALPVFAQTPPTPDPTTQSKKADAGKPQEKKAEETPSYQSLVERLKKNDRTVDFRQLRVAYSETEGFSPYGTDREGRQKMFAALSEKNFSQAAEQAEKILKDKYVDIYAHFVAARAYGELGKADKSEFHDFAFNGLIKSIMGTGDGKTPEAAFFVIAVEEEYALLDVMGMKVKGQSLIRKDGHSYDLMRVTDSQTGKETEFYFNIDRVFGQMEKRLKNKN